MASNTASFMPPPLTSRMPINDNYPVPRHQKRDKPKAPVKIIAGATIGGLIGLPAGPLGFALGATAGCLVAKEISDKKK